MANVNTGRRRSPTLWLLFSMRGRISRGIYWGALIALFSVNFALYFQLLGMTEADLEGSLPLVLFVIALAALYANIAISVKRLHDIGYAGFLSVAVLIPLVNIAFSIWVGILPGTAGPNSYGEAADVQP